MKNAFTLAEVLITLAIIGIVAAMTVPTLMTSARGKEYEVAAVKAQSTLANAFQMRYAMDGVDMLDYPGTALAYLTSLPKNPRPGEQPALPAIELDVKKGLKTKDGMFMTGSWNVRRSGDGEDMVPVISDNSYTPAFLKSTFPNDTPIIGFIVDTNGEKGPSRNSLDRIDAGSASPMYCGNVKTTYPDNYNGTTANQKISTNNCPDVVHFIVKTDGSVAPVGQRSRNILATGNSMISQ